MPEYERWRKFFPYVLWSKDLIDIWNDTVRLKSRIRFATASEVKKYEDAYRGEISRLNSYLGSICSAIERARWIGLPVDIRDVRRAESRTWLEYYVSEGINFETLCTNISSVLEDAEDELEKKIIKKKLIALHKRWFYDSKRGKGHDISIEGVATIIVPWEEKKEDYKSDLEKALKDKLLTYDGFERLEDELTQETVGFEEVETDEAERGVRAEQIEWAHQIITRQLDIRDFLR